MATSSGNNGFLKVIGGIVAVIAFIAVIMFVTLGPVGIQNKFTAWKATAYGSDWLVVQYTATGEVLNTWDLKNAAIHSEGHSDGIYFTTDHGVVHLSGNYLYVQNPTPEGKELYLKKRAVAKLP